jgi:hypothetical protein
VGTVSAGLAERAVFEQPCSGRRGVRPSRRPADRPTVWYGSSAEWQDRVERGLTRRHPGQVTVDDHDLAYFHPNASRCRVYKHAGLYVPGRAELVPTRVEFYERPPYDTFGLAPQDYPRVFADPGAPSKHRMPDDALCLYEPEDPAERRWTTSDGLVALLNIVQNHLFCELRWRNTGGFGGGVWPLDEAPHGLRGKDS